MLDVYETVDATRISQEAPVIVGRHAGVDYYPGGAANAARNCVALQSKHVCLVSAVGDDEAGIQLEAACHRFHLIDTDLTLNKSIPTTEKRRIVNSCGQHLIRIDRESKRLSCSLELKKGFETLLVSDYQKGIFTVDKLLLLTMEARNKGMYVVINGKPGHVSGYTHANCLVFNLLEAREALDEFTRCQHVELPEHLGSFRHEVIGQALFDHLYERSNALESLIVTLGDGGLLQITKNNTPYLVPAKRVKVADVVGAGDTVCATIAVRGNDYSGTLKEAVQNAASVVAQRGTAVPK